MVQLAADKYVHQPDKIGTMTLMLLRAATRGCASHSETTSKNSEREHSIIYYIHQLNDENILDIAGTAIQSHYSTPVQSVKSLHNPQ